MSGHNEVGSSEWLLRGAGQVLQTLPRATLPNRLLPEGPGVDVVLRSKTAYPGLTLEGPFIIGNLALLVILPWVLARAKATATVRP